MQANSTTNPQIRQWQEKYNSEYAKWLALGAAQTSAHKRALKAAKHLHPAHIAARERRTSLAVAHNAHHATLDTATWALLNGVQS